MPLSPHFSISDFLDFTKPVPLPPRIVNIRQLVSFTEKNMTRVTSSKPSRIDISWTPHRPPKGIPKDREGRVIWDAEIEIPETGNYELLSEGHPEIRLGDRELGNPESYVISAHKGEQLPLRITANEVGRFSRRVAVRINPLPVEATGVFPAKGADAAIICVGLNPDIEAEGYDRGFALPLNQQRLIREIASVNPRTLVVLSGGGAVDMNSWINQVPVILQTWYLGQSAGTALASILFGVANPSGHLPCTFDRFIESNPSFHDYPGVFPPGQNSPVVTYHEGIFYGYRGYDRLGSDPLFPFGYGLSYTAFAMHDLRVEPYTNGYQVNLTLTNTGHREGATVAQIYVSLTGESTPRPLRELKGFQRVELNPGESKNIQIPLPSSSLYYWHPKENCWVQPQGPIKVEAGFSERDIKLDATIIAPHLDPDVNCDKNITNQPAK